MSTMQFMPADTGHTVTPAPVPASVDRGTGNRLVHRADVAYARHTLHAAHYPNRRAPAASEREHRAVRAFITGTFPAGHRVTVANIVDASGMPDAASLANVARFTPGTDMSPLRTLAASMADAYGVNRWNAGRWLAGTLAAWCHAIDPDCGA